MEVLRHMLLMHALGLYCLKGVGNLQAAGLAPEDPTSGYMLQAGARLCKCLGEEFLPYLPMVMPPLLHSAQLRPDVAVLDTSEDEDDNDEVLFPIVQSLDVQVWICNTWSGLLCITNWSLRLGPSQSLF